MTRGDGGGSGGKGTKLDATQLVDLGFQRETLFMMKHVDTDFVALLTELLSARRRGHYFVIG